MNAAEKEFRTLRLLSVFKASGIGDEAYVGTVNSTCGSYDTVFWRQGQTIGTIDVSEPPGHAMATEALAKRLASLAAKSS